MDKPLPKVSFEAWDGQDFVVTVNESPVGQVLPKEQARSTSVWLQSAIEEISQIIKQS